MKKSWTKVDSRRRRPDERFSSSWLVVRGDVQGPIRTTRADFSELGIFKETVTYIHHQVSSGRFSLRLGFAHQAHSYRTLQGIIHRDLKAENFLYRRKESAIDDFQLIDFGISKVCPPFRPFLRTSTCSWSRGLYSIESDSGCSSQLGYIRPQDREGSLRHARICRTRSVSQDWLRKEQ